jgi:heat shock protein HtpX
VDKRVEALVEFAGGRDPGPIALPPPDDLDEDDAGSEPAEDGQDRFLPDRPPVELGDSPTTPETPGPWGPRR